MKKKLLKFDEETRRGMIKEIQSFFEAERGEQIGELAAMLVLDFFTETLAAEAYNKGVRDALQYMSERIEDGYSLEK